MPVQFFLKHDALLDLLAKYDTTKSGLHKGLVFSVDFAINIVQSGAPSISSPQYLASAKIYGVQGPYIDNTGDIAEIPGTDQTPCPHPPPCGFDLSGNFEIDKLISAEAVAKCYPQEP